MEVQNEQRKRIVNFKIFGDSNVEEIEKFERLTIVNGKKMFDTLLEMVKSYNKHHKITFTPKTETEVVDQLGKDGYPVQRMTLRKYRDLGLLEDENGSFWYTDGTNYMYNYEKVLDFAKRRKASGWFLNELRH